MKVFKSKKELTSYLKESVPKNRTIGMVPTMGALHDGHLSLVRRALKENSLVVVSIFVNPTQFNNKRDLKTYPRTLEKDMSLLKKLGKNIVIFGPTVSEIYPDGIVSKAYDFGGLDSIMEGQYRKGHFEGVATIVEALLTLVLPDKAYFGEKDYQQLQIIKWLVKTRQIPVTVVGCPIVRETSGLAMSSRNERLTKRLRKEASLIYSTLQVAKIKFGTKSANSVTDWVRKQFSQHADLRLEYFEIRTEDTLRLVKRKQKNKKYRAFIAVYADEVRLIDNLAL